jgi:DNA-binding response OmpR family regulator
MAVSSDTTRVVLMLPPATAPAFGRSLQAEGFDVLAPLDLGGGWAAVRKHDPHLVVIDSGIGEVEALDCCAQIRQESDVPIALLAEGRPLTFLREASQRGADDCISHAITMAEFMLRVQALLRRAGYAWASLRQAGGITLSPEERRALVRGAEVPLTALEFDLLSALMERPRLVLPRLQLARVVWGENWEGDVRLVDSHLCRLRGKLGRAGLSPCPIRTVRGIGYVFRPDSG